MTEETKFRFSIWSAIAIALVGSFLILTATGCQRVKKDYQQTAKEQANNVFIDSINKRVALAEKRLTEKMDSVKISIQKQEQAISKFKPVYEKISTASDIEQRNITLVLLAKHRATPIKRD